MTEMTLGDMGRELCRLPRVTCSSFSSGVSVHVEYTRLPPTRSIRTLTQRKRRWYAACVKQVNG